MRPNGALRTLAVAAAMLAMSAGTAPMAQAATTTSCSSGLTSTSAPSVVTLGTSCSGFVDQGAPYVFNIAVLTHLIIPIPLSGPRAYYYYDAVETCSGYRTTPAFQATGCVRT